MRASRAARMTYKQIALLLPGRDALAVEQKLKRLKIYKPKGDRGGCAVGVRRAGVLPDHPSYRQTQ